VRLAVVGLLAFWCFAIFRPFLMPLVWGIVLAVALRPAFVWIERATGGRRKLAAILLVVVGLGAIVVPRSCSRGRWSTACAAFRRDSRGKPQDPACPDRVAQWPIVGPTVHETWNLGLDEPRVRP